MFSTCSAFIWKALLCKMGDEKIEVVYELEKPLKAIVFNHTEYEKETLDPRSSEAGLQFFDCLRDDLGITDIEHKLNLNKQQVISALIERNFGVKL